MATNFPAGTRTRSPCGMSPCPSSARPTLRQSRATTAAFSSSETAVTIALPATISPNHQSTGAFRPATASESAFRRLAKCETASANSPKPMSVPLLRARVTVSRGIGRSLRSAAHTVAPP